MRISAGFIPAGTSRSKSREDARHAQGRPTGCGSSTNYSAGQLPSRTSIGVRSKFAILSRPIRRLILTCVRRLELWQALMGNQTRREHLVRFYSILDDLQHKIGGAHKLADCSGRMDWPKRGVYFFHEQGENCSDTGDGPRVVRVGTHALKAGSRTKLWTRLSQHKGQPKTGGGNHRGSIFRLIVGATVVVGLDMMLWGRRSREIPHA